MNVLNIRMPYLILIGYILLLSQQATANEIVLIAHPDSELTEINKHEINNIYMGRKVTKENQNLIIYEQSSTSEIKKIFLSKLNGMTVPQYDAYWARLRFSGRKLPPKKVADDLEMLKVVSSNKKAIGYVSRKNINRPIQILTKFP